MSCLQVRPQKFSKTLGLIYFCNWYINHHNAARRYDCQSNDTDTGMETGAAQQDKETVGRSPMQPLAPSHHPDRPSPWPHIPRS